ncbi:SGNH/GDSL hydrolase family protein [Neotabrizicola shimadae]|uniref:Lipase n=1 Tax=Neotabrizicola shimadae TaxID=2807096 RepID=A0A8G0ZRD1_9RHOB|nr:SGNH/GDSL hydrolase family protein [Neotabrizicola shimadae]QYZ68612.1 lipase [Neotabrizicola shimadae]
MAVRRRKSGGRTAFTLAMALALASAALVIWWGGALWPAASIQVTDPGTLILESGALPGGVTAVLAEPADQAVPPAPLRLTGRFARPMTEDGAPRHEWPAAHAVARIDGPEVTLSFDDDENRYRLTIDSPALSLVLDRPGRHDLNIAGLGPGLHDLRVEKISESSAPRPFPVIRPGADTTALPVPALPRQIEVIGDSEAVGYGVTSPRRDCSAEEQFATTDTSQAFGPTLARALDADYRLIARSGMGLVRNYGGADAGRSLTSLYALPLPSDPDAMALPDAWSPRLVVLQLGTNDVEDSEQPHLPPGYGEAAGELMTRIRSLYPAATILVLLTSEPDAGRQAALDPVIARLQSKGGPPVALVKAPESDLGACHWHPSLADHAAMTAALQEALASLPAPWGTPAP